MKKRPEADHDLFVSMLELQALGHQVFDESLRAEIRDLVVKVNAARMEIRGDTGLGAAVNAYNAAAPVVQTHIGEALERLFEP